MSFFPSGKPSIRIGQLKMLDQQKQPITGDLAKFYILKQTKKF